MMFGWLRRWFAPVARDAAPLGAMEAPVISAVAAYSPAGYVVVRDGRILALQRADATHGGALVEPGGDYGPVRARIDYLRVVLSLTGLTDQPDTESPGMDTDLERARFQPADADCLRELGFPVPEDNLVWIRSYRMEIKATDPLEMLEARRP